MRGQLYNTPAGIPLWGMPPWAIKLATLLLLTTAFFTFSNNSFTRFLPRTKILVNLQFSVLINLYGEKITSRILTGWLIAHGGIPPEGDSSGGVV